MPRVNGKEYAYTKAGMAAAKKAAKKSGNKVVIGKVVKKAAPKKAGPRPSPMKDESNKPLRDIYYSGQYPISNPTPGSLGWYGLKFKGNRPTKQERLKNPPRNAARNAAKVKRKER